MIEKDYLGAWDLCGDDGKPAGDTVVTIESVRSEKLKTKETAKTHPDGKARCVIRFVGKRKAFVCNSTNCETISAMFGTADTDGWVGKKIALYVADVRNPAGGGTIPGIRVRPRPPAAGKRDTSQPLDRPVDPAMRAAQDNAFSRGAGDPADDYQR